MRKPPSHFCCHFGCASAIGENESVESENVVSQSGESSCDPENASACDREKASEEKNDSAQHVEACPNATTLAGRQSPTSSPVVT